MSEVLWMNIPLMVVAFALWVGIPLWLVVRRAEWHSKPEAHAVPAYLTVPAYAARGATPVQTAGVRLPRSAGYDGRLAMRPLTGDANG